MKFTITREQLIKPLQQLSGVLGSRPTLPILGNFLIKIENNCLYITVTDLEVEMSCALSLDAECEEGMITVPARKFLDICKGLQDDAHITIVLLDNKLQVRSGRSRYTLSTLPASDYPNIEQWQSDIELTLNQKELKSVIDKTLFSMANQDVRYYLNGMLFDLDESLLRTVATDGHRMSVAHTSLSSSVEKRQIIIPRKGIMELVKLLDVPEQSVTLQVGHSNIRAVVNNFIYTSKLVDGRFPDYRRVMPQETNKTVEASCEALKQAFSRAAILSNEKFRGVKVNLSGSEMRITANNPEQEEAEEVLDVFYEGDDLEIGFNVSYLLDVLNTLRCERVKIFLSSANTSTLIENSEDSNASYVVMPIRL